MRWHPESSRRSCLRRAWPDAGWCGSTWKKTSSARPEAGSFSPTISKKLRGGSWPTWTPSARLSTWRRCCTRMGCGRTAWRRAASTPIFRRSGWRRSGAAKPRNAPRRGLRRSDVRPILTFHRDRCLACLSCELACSLAHSAPRRVRIQWGGPPGLPGRTLEALRCEQCGEPLCVFACKSGALQRDALTGRVVLDDSRCVGCFMCLMVCPSGVRPDAARDRVVRCDVCEGRDVAACVTACPTGALAAGAAGDQKAQSGFSGRLVVIGSSAAGIAACEAAREHAPDCSITLVTADASPQYSRPLLSYVLAGAIEPSRIDWRAHGYLEKLGVQVLPGRKAAKLKTDAGPVVLDDGTELTFDALIVATGARGAKLSIPGADLAGVYGLRDLEDLEGISRIAGPGRCAVVLGGGNVGLQVCEAFLARDMNVTVVVASSQLLSQMLDATAARRVAELFR